MAIAKDAFSNAEVTYIVSSYTYTYAHTTSGSNRLMVVMIFFSDHNNYVSAITYNGSALSKILRVSDSNRTSAEIWYIRSPDTGSNNLAITFNNRFPDCRVVATTWTGVDTADPLDQQISATGNSATPSISLTPTVNNELVIGGAIHHNYNDISIGAGETVIYEIDEGTWSNASSYDIQTTAEAQAINFESISSDYWSAVGASFKEAESTTTSTTISTTSTSISTTSISTTSLSTTSTSHSTTSTSTSYTTTSSSSSSITTTSSSSSSSSSSSISHTTTSSSITTTSSSITTTSSSITTTSTSTLFTTSTTSTSSSITISTTSVSTTSTSTTATTIYYIPEILLVDLLRPSDIDISQV